MPGNEITDPDRRFKVFTNLLILANELNDPRLTELGLRMIPHENCAVRYWAVRVATNPSVWDKLNQNQADFLIGVTFNILANLAVIPAYSYKGAAVVTIVSELVLLAPRLELRLVFCVQGTFLCISFQDSP